MKTYRSMGEAVAAAYRNNIDNAVRAGMWDHRDCCGTVKVVEHSPTCQHRP